MAERSARRNVDTARLSQRKEAAVVGLRESSIVSLAAHGLLDANQVSAALHFRDDWAAIRAGSSPERLFERVDHSPGTAQGERIAAAKQRLKRCRAQVGAHGFQLLIKICGDGWHIRDLYSERRERDTATDMLRIHLSELACTCFRD